jgi:PIN domain nuclease of toxin-antitoxin system
MADRIDLATSGQQEIVASANLPEFHGEPFARILIVQAQQNAMLLVTRDANIAVY